MVRGLAVTIVSWAACLLGGSAACDSGTATTPTDARSDAALPDLPVAMVGEPDLDDPSLLGDDAVPADYACLGQRRELDPIEQLQIVGRCTYAFTVECVRVFSDGVVVADAPCALEPGALLEPLRSVAGSFGMEIAADGVMPANEAEAALHLVWHRVRQAASGDPWVAGRSGFLFVNDRIVYPWLAISTDHLHSGARGLVVAVVRDCLDRPVHGALLRIRHLDGTRIDLVSEPDGPAMGWLTDGCAPLRERTVTPSNGTAMLVNVPVHEGAVVVQAWARPDGEDGARLVSCATVTSEPDTHAHVSLWPLDDADPPCPGASP